MVCVLFYTYHHLFAFFFFTYVTVPNLDASTTCSYAYPLFPSVCSFFYYMNKQINKYDYLREYKIKQTNNKKIKHKSIILPVTLQILNGCSKT